MLACFPAGRGDPANRGRFVLKLSRSGINHNQVCAVSLLSAAYSLSTITRIRGERFLETGHNAVTVAPYLGSQRVLSSITRAGSSVSIRVSAKSAILGQDGEIRSGVEGNGL